MVVGFNGHTKLIIITALRFKLIVTIVEVQLFLLPW